jgi:hypothetical protein
MLQAFKATFMNVCSKVRVLVPSLMFTNKAKAYPSGETHR